MRYENNVASVTVAERPSEASEQRRHLLKRLQDTANNKMYDGQLDVFFNINSAGVPDTYQQMIDAIKGGKFTLDPKKTKKVDEAAEEQDTWSLRDYGPFYGIVFTDFPGPDFGGREAARKKISDKYQEVKDNIIILSPADGLAALREFEAWWPEGVTVN